MSNDPRRAETFLAIDIGGSKLLTALVSRRAAEPPRLWGVAHRALERDCGRGGVLSAIESAVGETLRSTGANIDELLGIGATIPGLADPRAPVPHFHPAPCGQPGLCLYPGPGGEIHA